MTRCHLKNRNNLFLIGENRLTEAVESSTYAHQCPIGRSGSWRSVVDEMKYYVHKKIVSKLFVITAPKNKYQLGLWQWTNKERNKDDNMVDETEQDISEKQGEGAGHWPFRRSSKKKKCING